MNQAFIDILKKLIAEQGREALFNVAKGKSLLADYTGSEYKKERRFIVQAVEAGAAKAIGTAQDLAACKKTQAKELEEEFGLSPAVAADVVDTLALVLRGDASKTQTAPSAGTPPKPQAAPPAGAPPKPQAAPPAAAPPPPQKPKTAKPGLTESGDYLVRTIASDTEIEITGYTAHRVDVQIPSQIEGLPVTSIGDGAFANKGLNSVLIPPGVTYIGNGAFSRNSLEHIVIPNSVTHIGIGAFADNYLRSVVISNSVTRIEAEAFVRNIFLESVFIPDSVTYIGAMAFMGSNSRINVNVSDKTFIEGPAFPSNATITVRKA